MLVESIIFIPFFLARRLKFFRCLVMQDGPSKDQHLSNKLLNLN